MSKIKKARRVYLFVSAFLVITLALLIHVNFARAEGLEGISPNEGFEYGGELLAGQSVSISTSQTTSFGSHSVVVTSILNKSLTATFTVSSKDATGLWWITLIGTGGKTWFDFGYGLIAPSGGTTASVDVYPVFSLGLATGSAWVTSDVSVAEPFKYSIKIAGSAYE